MPSPKSILLLSIILFLPLINGSAQEASSRKGKAIEGELVNFSSIHTKDQIYFKVTIEGLKKDLRLVLEKEVSYQEGPIVVDTDRAIGSDRELALLNCLKDADPDPETELYRLRGIRFQKNGDARSTVLLERRVHRGLMSMKQGRE
jgi:hypothetical protein